MQIPASARRTVSWVVSEFLVLLLLMGILCTKTRVCEIILALLKLPASLTARVWTAPSVQGIHFALAENAVLWVATA